jgi:hypothetical protein
MSQDNRNLKNDEESTVKPDASGQSTDLDQQALEDVEKIVTYGATETTSGNTENKEKPSQEPVTKPQEDTPDQKDQYELAGIKFTEDDVSRWVELEKSNDPKRKETWEGELHKRGLELNERESMLKTRAKELESDQNVLTEYKAFRKIIDSDKDAKEYFKKLVKDPRTAVAPEIAEIKAELSEIKKSKQDEAAEEKAMLKLKSEYDDFSPELCDKVLAEFDFDDPYDMYKALYLASKGMRIDEIVQKKLAATNENELSLPPLASGKQTTPKRNFRTVEEATEALYKDLGLTY